MEELATALERETLNSIGGTPVQKKMGRPRVNLPKPVVKRIQADIEKARVRAMQKKRKKACVSVSYQVARIERMMQLAGTRKGRFAA